MNFEDEECIPIKIEPEDKFHSADLNCNECNEIDCPYWKIYNEI